MLPSCGCLVETLVSVFCHYTFLRGICRLWHSSKYPFVNFHSSSLFYLWGPFSDIFLPYISVMWYTETVLTIPVLVCSFLTVWRWKIWFGCLFSLRIDVNILSYVYKSWNCCPFQCPVHPSDRYCPHPLHSSSTWRFSPQFSMTDIVCLVFSIPPFTKWPRSIVYFIVGVITPFSFSSHWE